MIHFLFNNRQSQNGAESRLCFNVSKAPDYLSKPAEAVTGTVATGADFAWKQMKGLGNGAYEGISRLWRNDTQPDEIKNQKLQGSTEFFTLAPKDMQDLINRGFTESKEDITLAEAVDLLSTRNWIDAFKTPGIFDETIVRLEPLTLKQGALGLLKSVPAAERKRIFTNYVDKFVPVEIQQDHQAIFGTNTEGPAHENDIVNGGSTPTILNTMDVMVGDLGITADPSATDVARDALTDYYHYTDTIIVNGVPVENKAHVREDFKNLLRAKPGIRDERDILRSAPSSLIKGAINLDVLDDAEVKRYATDARSEIVDIAKTTSETTRDVNDFLKIAEREASEQSETMGTMYKKLGGWGKLALFGMAFMAMSSQKVRGVAFGAGVFGFASYFLGKNKHPFRPIEQLAMSANNKANELLKPTQKRIGMPTKLTQKELELRGSAVTKFMSEELKEDMNTSINGFQILYDMPLDKLRDYVYLDVTNESGNKGILKSQDPLFKEEIRVILKNSQADESAADRFFGQTHQGEMELPPGLQAKLKMKGITKYQAEAGDALASVFFLIGARQERNIADVQYIEEVRRTYGTTYDHLPNGPLPRAVNGRTDNPRDLFLQIAEMGKADAPSMTLGEFMQARLDLSNPSVDQAEEIEESEFDRQVKKLKEYTDTKDIDLDVEDHDSNVTIGLDTSSFSSVLSYPVTMTKEEFLKAESPEKLADLWVERALPEKVKDIAASDTAKAKFSGVFGARVATDFVYYSPDARSGSGYPEGQTPKFVFMQADAETIAKKYDKWYIVPTPPPKTPDPLEY